MLLKERIIGIRIKSHMEFLFPQGIGGLAVPVPGKLQTKIRSVIAKKGQTKGTLICRELAHNPQAELFGIKRAAALDIQNAVVAVIKTDHSFLLIFYMDWFW